MDFFPSKIIIQFQIELKIAFFSKLKHTYLAFMLSEWY